MAQRTRPVPQTGVGAFAAAGNGGTRAGRRRRMRFDRPRRVRSRSRDGRCSPCGAFLGFTFCFAGLQKLANPNFFNANSPVSIQAQLIASNRISPLHLLLGHLISFAVPIGIVIALAEVAVGSGCAPRAVDHGWRRRVGWPCAHPVPDGELPLVPLFHGRRHRLLLRMDPAAPGGLGRGALPRRRDRRPSRGRAPTGPPTVVPVRFELVQQVCGHYEKDTCTAQEGGGATSTAARSSPTSGAASSSAGPMPSIAGRWSSAATAVAASAVVGAVAAGAAAGLGRAVGGAKDPDAAGTSALSPTAPGRGAGTTTTAAGRADDDGRRPRRPGRHRPARGSDWPARSRWVAQPPSRTRRRVTPVSCCNSPRACSSPTTPSVPTLAAPSDTRGGAKLIVCPCHGSEFDPSTGAVVSPPAPRGLTPIHVRSTATASSWPTAESRHRCALTSRSSSPAARLPAFGSSPNVLTRHVAPSGQFLGPAVRGQTQRPGGLDRRTWSSGARLRHIMAKDPGRIGPGAS